MTTKVTILGMDEPRKNGKGKIEFVKYIEEEKGTLSTPILEPCSFKNIELVAEKYTGDDVVFDLFFAYDINRACGCLYLGHFNDGIV